MNSKRKQYCILTDVKMTMLVVIIDITPIDAFLLCICYNYMHGCINLNLKCNLFIDRKRFCQNL